MCSSSSCHSAGQRLTPHNRTLEVRPGRINKKLELNYDYDVKEMKLNYYSMCWLHDLMLCICIAIWLYKRVGDDAGKREVPTQPQLSM